MHCVRCGFPADVKTFVRPLAGGRRKLLLFCDEDCRELELLELDQCGFIETTVVLGYDVFIPIWDR